jgi:hypothetical protein
MGHLFLAKSVSIVVPAFCAISVRFAGIYIFLFFGRSSVLF